METSSQSHMEVINGLRMDSFEPVQISQFGFYRRDNHLGLFLDQNEPFYIVTLLRMILTRLFNVADVSMSLTDGGPITSITDAGIGPVPHSSLEMTTTPLIRSPIRVIIVNYKSAHMVRSLLLAGAFMADDDIIVVDNASEPDEVLALCTMIGARSLLLERNCGFAGGVNAAITTAEVTDRPILLLNPDVTLDAYALNQLIKELWRTKADGVAPLLMDLRGGVQVGAAGGNVTLGAIAAYFLFLSTVIPTARGIFYTRRQLRRTTTATWLCMACLLVRPGTFERFGPLPDNEVVYGEDIAWGTTATARGATFRLVPEVTVIHQQGASGGGAAWTGAAARLFRRRLGPVSATLAVASMRAGLRVRRLLGRRIEG
jgi:N-acetylglucosaminyl-diphospho-decaprenol L-rhamnosyltransferase